MKLNKCNLCDYACSQANILKKHLKIHSQEKSFKCNQCDYASVQAGNLKTHMSTHSGEKANKCNQCDYASSQVGNLTTHLKTHSGGKSNKCNQCTMQLSFSKNGNRRFKPDFHHSRHFSQYDYFRQTICRLASVQFHF